jgi:thioredoxin 1
MSNIKHLDGPTFEVDVLQASEPVVVDFYADWCGPCRMMTPVVEQLAIEFAGKVTVGKLDVDVNQDLAIQYGVMGIPTLGLFRDGKLVDRLVGYPGGATPIRAWIQRNLPVGPAATQSHNGAVGHTPVPAEAKAASEAAASEAGAA